MEATVREGQAPAVVVALQPGEQLTSEAGAMMFISGDISMDVEMPGGVMGGLKRKLLAGESLFLTHYRANGAGAVGITGPFPGSIRQHELDGEIICEKHAYLAHHGEVEIESAFAQKLGMGIRGGGEGFFLQRLKGKGTVWLHGGGDFLDFDLAAGQRLIVDTGLHGDDRADGQLRGEDAGRGGEEPVRRRGALPRAHDRPRPCDPADAAVLANRAACSRRCGERARRDRRRGYPRRHPRRIGDGSMGFLDKAKQAAAEATAKAKEGVEDVQLKRELSQAYNELGKVAFELVEGNEIAHPKLEAVAEKIRALNARDKDDGTLAGATAGSTAESHDPSQPPAMPT